MSAMSQAQASNGSSAPAPARIAILGGGAAGLVAARILSRQQRRKGNNDIVIKVLEKDDSFAGVWNYQSRSSTRPMYRNLRTNLPKEIMAYREFPWPPANNKHHHETSFVTHKNVADYLRQYCDHFCLQQYIQTGCRVDQLTCLPNTRSRLSPNTSGDDSEAAVWPQIRLDWTDKNMNVSTNKDSTSRQCSEIFDAVYVCNGHYSVPAFPEIPGLHQYFTGTTLHSIAYDVPEAFANQTVLCVGGRASGSDLAREIAKTASTVYLSDSAFPVTSDQPSITQHNVTWLPKTTEILPDGRVAFAPTIANAATGQHVITHPPVQVDTIIFCSGYDYNFPFINERSNLELNAANRRVQPLFEQLWHADAPNVAFIGLPHSVIPFPLFELQAEAVARSWRLGDGNNDDNDNDNNSRMQQLQVPTGVSERKRAANADAASGGPNGGRVPEDTHYLGSAQWDYCRRMAAYAGILDDALEGYLAINQVGADETKKRLYAWFYCHVSWIDRHCYPGLIPACLFTSPVDYLRGR